MKRTRFVKQAAMLPIAASVPLGLASEEPILADAELQVEGIAGQVTPLFRAPLTYQALRGAFRSPLVSTLRIAKKAGCVGVGWRFSTELGRNVAEVDLRPQAWRSEQQMLDYVHTLITKGGVAASRIMR